MTPLQKGLLITAGVVAALLVISAFSGSDSSDPDLPLYRAAVSGDAEAQLKIGQAYAIGDDSNVGADEPAHAAVIPGVHRDDAKAAYWYGKAANQGVVTAQRVLSVFYFWGNGGLPKDYRMAVYWARKAAAQGDPRDVEQLNALRTIAEVDPAGAYSPEARKTIRAALDEPLN